MSSVSNSLFKARLNGPFSGIITWDQLSELWSVVTGQPEGWYIYAVGEALPQAPADGPTLIRFVQGLDELLRREHREEYCGIVYADDRGKPSIIKIFDPHSLGSSCGSSGTKTLPGWLLTRMPPEQLDDHRLLPEGRKRWWRKLFHTETEAQ